MASSTASPVIVLLIGLSLTGCALSPIQSVRDTANSGDHQYLETLADIELGRLLNYQVEDPLGDHALIRLLLLTAPKVVWLTATGQGYGELLDEIFELRSQYPFEPIGLDRFANMRELKPEVLVGDREIWSKNDDVFMDVISRELRSGIRPTTGICHRWSAAYRKDPQTGPFPFMFSPSYSGPWRTENLPSILSLKRKSRWPNGSLRRS